MTFWSHSCDRCLFCFYHAHLLSFYKKTSSYVCILLHAYKSIGSCVWNICGQYNFAAVFCIHWHCWDWKMWHGCSKFSQDSWRVLRLDSLNCFGTRLYLVTLSQKPSCKCTRHSLAHYRISSEKYRRAATITCPHFCTRCHSCSTWITWVRMN